MKVLFLTPPLKAWDSHGFHRAANQMHAQAASFIREKGLAEVDAGQPIATHGTSIKGQRIVLTAHF